MIKVVERPENFIKKAVMKVKKFLIRTNEIII